MNETNATTQHNEVAIKRERITKEDMPAPRYNKYPNSIYTKYIEWHGTWNSKPYTQWHIR